MRKSVLIRYTDKKYAESYLDGNISLTSLSLYWDIYKGKLNYFDVANGKFSQSELQEAIKYTSLNQQDYSEGVASELPYAAVGMISDMLPTHNVSNVKFRVEAYGYCNLSCFYRVDYRDIVKPLYLDVANLAYIANQRGIHVSPEEILDNKFLVEEIIKKCIPFNSLLSPSKYHVVQLPDVGMDNFGNSVILIKDEDAFTERIINAVKKEKGDCVIGDVQYNSIVDVHRLRDKYHITVISYPKGKHDGLFDMNELIKDFGEIPRYGCLDKYDKFSNQREWRICWLPKEHNYERKELHLGDLRDIAEVLPTEKIRERLLNLYPGYWPGLLSNDRLVRRGTLGYEQFKRKVESIDGKCRLIFDICECL